MKRNRLLVIMSEGSFTAKFWKAVGKRIKKLFALIPALFTKLVHGFNRVMALIAIRTIRRRMPINGKQIMFINFQNRYTCNAKYICEELLRRGTDCRIVFAYAADTKKFLEEYPPEVVMVLRGSYAFYCEMAASHIWVDNALNFLWNDMPKKKDQVYFQTWHGSLGFKRLRPTSDKFARKSRLADKKTDFIISNSAFEDDVYRGTFWPTTQILRLGHARTDVLFEKDPEKLAEITARVRAFYHIPDTVRLALYAPTFRDDRGTDPYGLNFQKLRVALKLRFGGTWFILARYHFHVAKQASKLQLRGNKHYAGVINATAYADIQELMVASDVGITDYSSWLCDYVLTRRPAFIFATDYDKYNEEHGLYYPLEDSPFPVATDNDQFEKNVLFFDDEDYQRKIDAFLEWTGCVDDGHASERIVDKLVEYLN
ncbi:MAG: CDP-glycerol glycerophosphotransferase family protein [Oscillospiraceae bacterium]|nr:CDP-glycerol glycerophosphotransferase family protein [Oscillospiraceae bacterium]